MAKSAKTAKAAKADDTAPVNPEAPTVGVEAPQIAAPSMERVLDVRDSSGESLRVGDKVQFEGTVLTLNDPDGVTVIVGSQKDVFVQIALKAQLVSKQE